MYIVTCIVIYIYIYIYGVTIYIYISIYIYLVIYIYMAPPQKKTTVLKLWLVFAVFLYICKHYPWTSKLWKNTLPSTNRYWTKWKNEKKNKTKEPTIFWDCLGRTPSRKLENKKNGKPPKKKNTHNFPKVLDLGGPPQRFSK